MHHHFISFSFSNHLESIWLTDFARALPPSAQLDGFDLDTSQVPPPEWLPPNVSVRHLNCLEPFPEELIGKYDIVHVQFFNLAIQNRDPVPIVENLLTLLSELPIVYALL